MNCYHCGHQDALALFSSLLCVNSRCKDYDAAYAKEKGYNKPETIVGVPAQAPSYLGETCISITTNWDGTFGWSGIYWATAEPITWDLNNNTITYTTVTTSTSMDCEISIGWDGICGYSGMCDYFDSDHLA